MSPQKLREYSEQHLYHELTMFWKLTEILSKEQGNGITQTALLESYVIHLRNLIEFFYRRRAELKKYQETDVIAEDFFDDPTDCLIPPMSPDLKKALERANKEVNHLTTGRRIGKGEDWKVLQLFNQ